MATPAKQGQHDAQGAAQRRSTRLSITIPITMSGKDTGGHTFKENSRTVVINKQGAKILTFHQLAVGAEVTIENRILGRTAKATVVWVGDRPSPKDALEVGIQLANAENIWGIEFPPDDWQEGPPAATTSQKVEPQPPASAPPSPPPPPAEPSAPVDSAAPKAPEIPRPTVPSIVTPPRPTVSPGSLETAAQASVTRFTQQIEDAFHARFRQFEQRLTSLTQQIGLQTQATLQEAANRQEEKTVQAIEQRFGGLEQRLQTTRADLEALLPKLQELQGTSQAEIEKAQRNIQTAGFAALQGVTEDLDERVQQELEAASTHLAEETRKRVEDAGSAAVETFSQEASARLTKLTEDYLATLAPELEARRSQFEQTLVEIQQKGEREILERLQAAADESLDAAAQDLQKQAADAGLLLTDELKTSGRGLVEEARQELIAITREASETIGKQAEAVKLSTAELETARKLAVEEARKQLAVVTREVLDAVSKDAKAAQLSTAAREAAGKAALDQTREQLAILSRETLEAMTEEAKTLAKDYPAHVRKTLQDFQDQRTRELEDHLQKAMERQRQAVLKQIQKVAEEASGQAVVQVRSKCEQVVKEVSGDLERQRGAAASALKDWEEQARARLESQVAGLSVVLAEKIRQESEALTKDFQTRLHQAARAFQDENLREIEEKLKELTLKQIEESDAEFDKRAAENLELVSEQLKEKQERAVEEATDLFRTTIGQMFASLQISPKKPAESEPAKKRR
jgi:hypothetical protein